METPLPPSQTFGIELELLCLRPAFLSPDISPSQPGSGLIIDAVYDALIRHGVPVSDHNSLDINDSTVPFSQWRVEEEVLTLTPEEKVLLPEGYTVEPLELASRKFTHGHEDWRGEIAKVLMALTELELLYGVKFITNSSAGFHVHVGDSSPSPLPLRTAKNVFLFCTAYEAMIDSLHAVERIAIPWGKQERHHCYPLSFFAAQRGLGDTLFERLQSIEQIVSYEQLGSSFAVSADEMDSDEGCTGHNAAINFDNLFPDEEIGRYAEGLTGTIEFRQHAATLDLQAIVSWVEFTTALVRYCEEATSTATDTRNFILNLAAAVHPATSLSDHDFFCPDTMFAVPGDVRTYYQSLVSGTLPPSEAFLTAYHTPLLPLLETNAAQRHASTSRAAILSAIATKCAQGSYGHDPELAPFAPPEMMVFSMIEEKEERCIEAGFDLESDEGVSWVLRAAFAALEERHSEVVAEAFR